MEATSVNVRRHIIAFLRGIGIVKNENKNISDDNLLLNSYFYPFDDIFQPQSEFEKIVKEVEEKEKSKKEHSLEYTI